MRAWNVGVIYLIASLAALLPISKPTLEACDSPNSRYSVECDAEGRSIVIWLDCNNDQHFIKSAILGSEGAITNLTTLSKAGQTCFFPQLEISSQGDAVAMWFAIDSSKQSYSLFASTLPKGGNWSTAVCLTDDSEGVLASSAHLCINDANQINVMWESRTYYYSDANPEELLYKEELRVVTGSVENGWAKPTTLSILK